MLDKGGMNQVQINWDGALSLKKKKILRYTDFNLQSQWRVREQKVILLTLCTVSDRNVFRNKQQNNQLTVAETNKG